MKFKNYDLNLLRVNLDSRLIKPGEYFMPVKGEFTDGHKYINSALKNGAKGVIEVDELYEIAQYKLKSINPIVIAITGSVGKSTTRDFIFSLISTQYRVAKGTLNTKLGLATNIINNLKSADKFFVAEAGMDRLGELTDTGKFLDPDIVVCTAIKTAHLEKLGSLDNIIKAKSELWRILKPNKTLVVNYDDQNIKTALIRFPPNNGVKIIKVNSKSHNSDKYSYAKILTLINNNSDEKYKSIDEFPFQFIGDHNYFNALLAVAVARLVQISNHNIVNGLKDLNTPKGRLRIISGINDSIIIDDTYNALPDSVCSALSATNKYYKSHKLKGRKIAILGGMLELGSFENDAHKIVGDCVVYNHIDVLVVVKSLGKKILESKKLKNSDIKIYETNSIDETIKLLKETIHLTKDDIILVKASQGIRLEKVVKGVMKYPKTATKVLVRQDARWKPN